MADRQDTESDNQVRLQLRGDTARARWLSLRAHPEFCITAPDDSMAPALRSGARLTFNSHLVPREGDCALFVDAAGHAYVREYRCKSGGGYSAVPTNAAYQSTLHAKRDGLVVLGVLTAHTFNSRRAR